MLNNNKCSEEKKNLKKWKFILKYFRDTAVASLSHSVFNEEMPKYTEEDRHTQLCSFNCFSLSLHDVEKTLTQGVNGRQ